MLFEVGVLLVGYVGFRFFENQQQKNGTKKPQQLQQISQEKVIKNQVEKKHNHYLKVSSVFMGIAVVRQFFFHNSLY